MPSNTRECMINIYIYQSFFCISDEFEEDEEFSSTDEELGTPERSISKSSSVRAENSFDSLDSRDDHQVCRDFMLVLMSLFRFGIKIMGQVFLHNS